MVVSPLDQRSRLTPLIPTASDALVPIVEVLGLVAVAAEADARFGDEGRARTGGV